MASLEKLLAEDVLPNAARTDHDAFRTLLNSHKVGTDKRRGMSSVTH